MIDEGGATLTMDEWFSRMARRRAVWPTSDLAVVIDPVAAVAAGRDELDGGWN